MGGNAYRGLCGHNSDSFLANIVSAARPWAGMCRAQVHLCAEVWDSPSLCTVWGGESCFSGQIVNSTSLEAEQKLLFGCWRDLIWFDIFYYFIFFYFYLFYFLLYFILLEALQWLPWVSGHGGSGKRGGVSWRRAPSWVTAVSGRCGAAGTCKDARDTTRFAWKTVRCRAGWDSLAFSGLKCTEKLRLM